MILIKNKFYNINKILILNILNNDKNDCTNKHFSNDYIHPLYFRYFF